MNFHGYFNHLPKWSSEFQKLVQIMEINEKCQDHVNVNVGSIKENHGKISYVASNDTIWFQFSSSGKGEAKLEWFSWIYLELFVI